MSTENWHESILNFWFHELMPKQWFQSSAELDDEISRRFGASLKKLELGLPSTTKTDAQCALAAIIALDQFSRNIYRKSAAAFSNDAQACSLAHTVIDKSMHKSLDANGQYFVFMPFMHSENLQDQERGIELFIEIGNKDALKYAVEHHGVIEKFGRFPHRNAVMGRTNTPEEEVYLKTANTYGQ